MDVKVYKIIKIFKWRFVIKIPNFLHPWRYIKDESITFQDPLDENNILTITRELK